VSDDRPADPHLSVPPPDPWPAGPAPARPPATLQQTRRNSAVVYGFVALVSAAALARGWVGATTTGGRIAVAVVFGTILVGTLAVWVLNVRNPLELQVWDDRVVLAPTTGRQVHEPLTRDGGQVALVRRRVAKSYTWVLHQPGTDRWLPLDLFDLRSVSATLLERGWLPPPQP
jgi:hypothetical protein